MLFTDIGLEGEIQNRTLKVSVVRSGLVIVARRLHQAGWRLILLLATDHRSDRGQYELVYLLEDTRADRFIQITVPVPQDDPTFPSLATFYFPYNRFEREVMDMFGLKPQGHPELRHLVKHQFWPDDYFPLRKDAELREFEDNGEPFPFMEVKGPGVYEIPVGPVHAGVIEPGHFRFNVLGETILNMKPRLWFTHKGTERLFEGRTPNTAIELTERISGDTAVGHTLAFVQAVEAMVGIEVPKHALYSRVILLEVERIYNHIGDFGAICTDCGFAFINAHCMRLKEQLMRLNSRLTRHRLLRGMIIAGGVSRPLPLDNAIPLEAELSEIRKEFDQIVKIALQNTLLLDRLQTTGRLPYGQAVDHGVSGYVARASGIDRDVRRDHPFAVYPDLKFEIPVFTSEDVFARAMVRVEEVFQSIDIISQALAAMPDGALSVPVPSLPANKDSFGLVEGWRGAILCWIQTDANGSFWRVKVQDPSFLNWPALSFALLTNIVPDFPLINKSFNLSYSGNDL